MLIHHRLKNVIARPAIFVLFLSLSSTVFGEAGFDTKTKVRLVEKGVWLETEISPQALLAVLPQVDQNSDGRLEEEELSGSRMVILSYYAQKVQLAADERWLKTDSTYFAFRSPAAPTAIPDRFFIYHWYAVLRRPERLKLRNHLFEELNKACAHQGAIIDTDRILRFDFPRAEAADEAPERAVEFRLGKIGEVSLLESDSNVLQAGYLWLGLGLSGLLALRMASTVRSKLRREPKPAAEASEPEEMEMEESAVFS